MKFIQIYRRGKGCTTHDGHEFLVVVSKEVDEQGNWIPVSAASFEGFTQLQQALKALSYPGDRFVIPAFASPCEVPEKMGFTVLFEEWGVL